MKKNTMKTSKQNFWLPITMCMAIIAIAPYMQAEAAKEHVEEITTATHTYQIKMDGTLDEFNTADYYDTYGNSMRFQSKFQPNEYVIIENIGDTDVVNPRIVINGRRNRFSVDDILADIIKPNMTDAEKALAIWAYVANIELQSHDNDRRVDDGSILINKELANPVKLSNIYYCSGCQFAAASISVLCEYIGLKTRTAAMGSAHRIAEVWYDDDWHILDGDQRTFYLEKDNKTLASYDDIRNDPCLCDRNHDGGFASRGIKSRGSQYKNLPQNIIDINDIKPYLSTMAMTLRPGEKLIWRWDHIGKYRCGANDRNIKSDRPQGLLPYQLANGKMVYQPKLDSALLAHGADENVNIKSVAENGKPSRLQPAETGKPAYVVYKVSSAYPVVGGTVGVKLSRKTADQICRIYVSVYDANNWAEAWSAKDADTGELERKIAIDSVLNPLPTPAIYNYYVKFEIQANNAASDVCINEICIESDVQMSGTSLPSLSVGENNVAYRDESNQDRRVRITHGWNESSMVIPPLAPEKPTNLADGNSISVAALKRLKWETAKDPDGYIADYHIQISSRPDMLYPVSPVFDRIIFSAEPVWQIPQGWLRPYKTYYWRVRAKDNWGVWSGWSNVWQFSLIASPAEQKKAKPTGPEKAKPAEPNAPK